MTAAVMCAALRASADILPLELMISDPLYPQYVEKTKQPNDGIDSVVRVGSGQAVHMEIADISSAPFAAPLAAPVRDPLAPLKPVAGLAPKTGKHKGRKKPAKHAIEQLKHAASGGRGL